MPHDQRLHMGEREGFAQQRIFGEIDLADGEIIGGAPIAVHEIEPQRVWVGAMGVAIGDLG